MFIVNLHTFSIGLAGLTWFFVWLKTGFFLHMAFMICLFGLFVLNHVYYNVRKLPDNFPVFTYLLIFLWLFIAFMNILNLLFP